MDRRDDDSPTIGSQPGAGSPQAEDETLALGHASESRRSAGTPDSIGKYRILGTLGQGGMGVVYEAEQEMPKRRVALKVIRGGTFVDDNAVRMFKREADTLARLKHPNIAGIYEAGRTDAGQHFFAMELVVGLNLSLYLDSRPSVIEGAELRFRLRLFQAICEAVTRPNMRFVPIKNIEQQSILAVHRVRQGFVHARTAQANQIRGLLGEFGLVLPQGIHHIYRKTPELLEDASNELTGSFRLLILRLLDHLKELDKQVQEMEREIVQWHRQHEDSKRLEQIPGIGPITASALVASLGDAKSFQNGRQLAAWLGLVPR